MGHYVKHYAGSAKSEIDDKGQRNNSVGFGINVKEALQDVTAVMRSSK